MMGGSQTLENKNHQKRKKKKQLQNEVFDHLLSPHRVETNKNFFKLGTSKKTHTCRIFCAVKTEKKLFCWVSFCCLHQEGKFQSKKQTD
jgi:hypothetical protein